MLADGLPLLQWKQNPGTSFKLCLKCLTLHEPHNLTGFLTSIFKEQIGTYRPQDPFSSKAVIVTYTVHNDIPLALKL